MSRFPQICISYKFEFAILKRSNVLNMILYKERDGTSFKFNSSGRIR